MAVHQTFSSLEPALHEEKTADWVVSGCSWIERFKVDQKHTSPTLFTIRDYEFGMHWYPKGQGREDGLPAVYAWCKAADISQIEASYTLSVLDQGEPKFFCSENVWPRTDNGKNFQARGLVAFQPQNDSLTFRLKVKVWTNDFASLGETSVKRTDCDTSEGRCSTKGKMQLASDFKNLWDTQKHTDVILNTLDEASNATEAVHAHQIVLAARSPVFEKMFFGEGSSFAERSSDGIAQVQMVDVDASVARMFLHSIYTSEIDEKAWESDELLCHLLSAFHKYQVHELMQRCLQRIVGLLSEENIAERLMMSDLLDLPELRSAALRFITSSSTRLANVQASDGFKRLVDQRPKLVAEILATSVPPPAKKARTSSAGKRGKKK
eukprot:TRINITY_DN1283_c0_g1_i1.p1 TRINITY_DN1283_c0_g1~~TRINITY_DN1283_c0_g1_i1.p1  ORF type:complete len:380 (-),score=57.05 TRINITY_DN1283_c0_g1_i1:132-1271(-)